MRRVFGGAFLLAIVGLLGLILGRSIAAPTSTPATTTESANIDAGDTRIVEQIDFRDTPLKEVIASLQKQTDANIVVHWRALEAAGIDSVVPVTLRLKKLPLVRVLEILGEVVGGGTVPIGVRVDRGVVVVSTKEDLAQGAAVVRLYDVRDLIESNAALQEKVNKVAPNTCFPSGGSGLMTGNPDPYQDVMDLLSSIIMDQVAPDTWRDAGGTLGSIRMFNGRLIVSTSPELHKEVAKLLETIRKG